MTIPSSGSLASIWGNWAPNRLADRAGRHRRLAIGCALLTVPFLVMASAPTGVYSDRVFSVAHALVGGSFLWLARDLTRTASLLGSNRLPHPSLGSMLVGFGVLYRHRTEHFEQLFEAQPLLAPGLVLFAVAVGVLALDDLDWRPGQIGGLVGRMLLVVSAATVGFAAIGGMFTGYLTPPAYWLGVGSVGVLLVGMALFEGRLLWRAIDLARSIRMR